MQMNDFVIDPWSFLDYKPTFVGTKSAGGARSVAIAPGWVGEHFRRLQAYKVYESYCRNRASIWIDTTSGATQADIDARREYGDANVIAQQVLASLIGTDQKVEVLDANKKDAPSWLLAQQDELEQWMTRVRFLQKMHELERTAVKLGDGLYVLAWNEKKGDLELHVYDPGFYFPVLDDEDINEEYPRKIHIAWEYDRDVGGVVKRFVRRLTWELLEYDLEAEGTLPTLPWNEGPSTESCFYSDKEWDLEQVRDTVENFSSSPSRVFSDRKDLEIDFIPVVHVPNTTALQEHFGISVLGPIMPLFDDLTSTDTDLQASSATTGSPPISVQGGSIPKADDGTITTYGPGQVFETGDGKIEMLDTSNSLVALLSYSKYLLERISVNGRIPESMLGRIKPSEVPSGITLQLSFAPHSSMIEEMRLVRDDKYGLLFKMASRYLMKAGKLSQIAPVKFVFGSYLPADVKEAMDVVQQGLNSKPAAISTETAVAMLMRAGLPIESALDEVKRIREEDFEAANQLLAATGDPDIVRTRLGLPKAPTAIQDPNALQQPPQQTVPTNPPAT